MDLYLSYTQDLTKVIIFDSWKEIEGGGYMVSVYGKHDAKVYFDITNNTIYKHLTNLNEEIGNQIVNKKTELGYSVYDKSSFENKINNLQNG